MKELLINKDKITSLELLKEVNVFREKEYEIKVKNNTLTETKVKKARYVKLEHKDLLKVIRDEFSEEINEGKISPVEYKDKKGEKRPMFILTLNQAKQVLLRESKYVRRAVIQYIEKLEEFIKELPKDQKNMISFEKTLETIVDVYDCKKDLSTIPLKELIKLKRIIEKNFIEEEPQEVLKDLAQDIYYIFKVDNKNTPMLPLSEILKLIKNYIEIKPMNLYKVEVKQKLFELE